MEKRPYRFVNYTESEEKEIVNRYKNGETISNLSSVLQVGETKLYKLLKKHEITKNRSDSKRKYSLNQSVFENAENNPEAAYWVGFLMADGCVVINPKISKCLLTTTLARPDHDHLVKFHRFLETNAPVLQFNRIIHGMYRESSRSDIRSKKIVEDLGRYGIVPRKSKTAEVKLLENNPHFWRGVFDGDGHISCKKYPVIEFCGSRNLIEQFVCYVEIILGIIPTIHRTSTIFKAMLSGRKAMKFINILYKDANFYLDRKWKIAKACLDCKYENRDCGEFTLEKLNEIKTKYGTWKRAEIALGLTKGYLAGVCFRKKKEG